MCRVGKSIVGRFNESVIVAKFVSFGYTGLDFQTAWFGPTQPLWRVNALVSMFKTVLDLS